MTTMTHDHRTDGRDDLVAWAAEIVMHHHVVLFTAWRHRRGLPGAEATLRRDLRAATYHPFGPEETLVHAGKVALGLPADER